MLGTPRRYFENNTQVYVIIKMYYLCHLVGIWGIKHRACHYCYFADISRAF